MGTFIQLIVDGLSTGSIYAALALAIVLVNQATGLINFAQGAMAVLSAYIAYVFVQMGLPLIVAIILTVLISFVLGGVTERFLVRKFERGDPDTAVVVTIGILTLTPASARGSGATTTAVPVTLPALHRRRPRRGGELRSLGTIGAIVAIMIVLQLLFLARSSVSRFARWPSTPSRPPSRAARGTSLMIGWGLAAALGAIAGSSSRRS